MNKKWQVTPNFKTLKVGKIHEARLLRDFRNLYGKIFRFPVAVSIFPEMFVSDETNFGAVDL